MSSAVRPSTPVNLTNTPSDENAEWPYFHPIRDEVLFFYTQPGSQEGPRYRMNGDASDRRPVPQPGGGTISHMGFAPDGSEFIDAQRLTSFDLETGQVGTIDDPKSNATLLSQLAALGLEPVPTSEVPGQAGAGTFALSADWSPDGGRVVFDALVRRTATGDRGVGIFVYDLAADVLTLVYGPEAADGELSGNFNFSVRTPKWIP